MPTQELTARDEFDLEPLGQWSDVEEYVVDRERLIAYARAINDAVPAHLSGEYASPVFSVVPAFQVVAPLTFDMPPAAKRMNGLHGEQEFRFHQPIRPGMVLHTRAMPLGIAPRSTGTTITIRALTSTAEGEPVVEQFVTVFIRDAFAERAVGEAAPELPPFSRGQLLTSVESSFDVDQPYRYMGASGDTMPLHSDNTFARTYGFPGIILHGNCTFATATRALLEHTADNDTTRVKRLTVRYSQWVTPYDTVTTHIYDDGLHDGRHRYRFESLLADGRPCLSNGLIEIAA